MQRNRRNGDTQKQHFATCFVRVANVVITKTEEHDSKVYESNVLRKTLET
jgi:hypothetical protein